MLDRILAALPRDYPWQAGLQYFDSIDSTNTYLKKQAALGAPHGTAAIADCQTLGRGRLGRSFQSPSGCGIYLSVLLRPNCPPQDLMHLTCAAAEAMCDAVETTTGLRPGIKWTNDLVVGNRKIAGILTENGLNAQGLVDYAIIGTGINCCQQPEDFPPELRSTAGSLAMALGRSVDRPELAAQMLAALARMDDALFTGKERMLSRYRQDCITLGKEISLVRGTEIRHGTALDIGPQGDLIVRFRDTGEVAPVSSGEVSVRGLYGYV